MVDNIHLAISQLKDTCRLTHSKWVVWFERVELYEESGNKTDWALTSSSYGLSKAKEAALTEFISRPSVSTWMAGALSTGRTRSRNVGDLNSQLNCERIYLFPNQEAQKLLAVGAEILDTTGKGFFKVLVRGVRSDHPVLNLSDDILNSFLYDTGADGSYDLRRILNRVISVLVSYIRCDIACLGIRQGDAFRLESAWNYPENSLGQIVDIEDNPVLLEIVETRASVVVHDLQKDGACPMVSEYRGDEGSWIGVPIVVGKRVIGAVCFLSEEVDTFDQSVIRLADTLVEQIAPSIETIVTFAEISRHLGKQALLNELASAVAIGIDIVEVSQRIVERLRRVFNTNYVAVLLPSPDKQYLREYGETVYQTSHLMVPYDHSLAGHVMKTGMPVRIGDLGKSSEWEGLSPQARSELSVPLKFRGNVIGVLDIEFTEPDAFTRRDELLLVVIASHLAGLIENVRLHEETRNRARDLELIHQVVERIVGLVNVGEIAKQAAELMVERFAYQTTMVLIADDQRKYLRVEGVSGIGAEEISLGFYYPIDKGIVGQAYITNQSLLISEGNLGDDELVGLGRGSGSVMCVPLRERESKYGVIVVVKAEKSAFTHNDRLALEALAGVLSSVIMNAHNYQQLQTNLRHLQAARETALDISADLDLDTLLERVTNRARELVGAKGAELGLVDEERRVVEIKVSETPWKDYYKDKSIPFESGVAGQLVTFGESIVVEDYNSWDGKLMPDEDAPFHTVAGVPLMYQGKVIGTLTVSDDDPEKGFGPEDLQLLELLAPQIAVSVRNARLYHQLQEYIKAEQTARERLIQSARLAAVGEMAAGVAHELNNPLTIVAGFVELILSELPQDFTQREELELVLKESQRAQGVVRRLLDFARPGEGLREKTNQNDMVRDVTALVRHLARTGGVEISADLQEDLLMTHVDRNQIKQVLLNLIHNALHAMPHGGKLNIKTRVAQRMDMEWVIVSVEDTGHGIPDENQGRLFEPFFTTRPPGEGTGLGLAVSYGIVTDHGGFIEVESEISVGSRFSVWLPVLIEN